jgi:hypothetical protein
MSDKEVMAEHLALYDGNKELAQKSIDMTKATINKLTGETAKH